MTNEIPRVYRQYNYELRNGAKKKTKITNGVREMH